jgi:hypothetical protein
MDVLIEVIHRSGTDMKCKVRSRIHDYRSYFHLYKDLDHLLINIQLEHMFLCFFF